LFEEDAGAEEGIVHDELEVIVLVVLFMLL
jgi:hypothetical protein